MFQPDLGCAQFVTLRGVMSAEEVAAANAVLDKHEHEFSGLEAAQDMLGWEPEDREPFVKMLAHERIVPFLNKICGPGFRMDHAPTLIRMDEGDGGRLNLHGSSGPGFDPKQYYIWQNGEMHNGLVVVNWMLCDQDPSTGGFVRPIVFFCANHLRLPHADGAAFAPAGVRARDT